jgi:hypothetical protein
VGDRSAALVIQAAVVDIEEIMAEIKKDQDAQKGASEAEHNKPKRNVGLQEQLGHRDQDPLIKDADSDFPEPGPNPEHSGEGKTRGA